MVTPRRLVLLVVGCLIAAGLTPAAARPLRLALAQTELRLYPTADAFAAHMAQRVTAAAAAGRPNLILLPEDVALPLLLLDDYPTVKACRRVEEAVSVMLGTYDEQVGAACRARQTTPLRALLALKAPRVEKLYRSVFGELARRNRVWIAAGSAPLTQRGETRNVAYLFAPDGSVRARTAKCHLIPLEECLEFRPGSGETVAPWTTSLGVLGMLICADAFVPGQARALRQQGAQVLLNCCANPERWAGAEAGFQAQSLPARTVETGLAGAQCFAVGRLFDLPFEGRSQVVAPDGRGGYRIVARAQTCDREEVVAATLELP